MQNVFKQGDAYFNTGDLVRDIGFRHAQFVDRLGDTFRWKGENVSTTEVENIVSDYEKIAEAVVYGVEIPHTNGRAGMAAITLNEGCQLDEQDLRQMLVEFKKAMPAYAVPVFLRIQKQMQTTGTFKYQKNTLKTQGFDLKQCDEKILVLLPNQSAYCEADPRNLRQYSTVSISLLSHDVAYFLIRYDKFVAFIIKHRQLFYFLLALASYLATIRSIKRSGA